MRSQTTRLPLAHARLQVRLCACSSACLFAAYFVDTFCSVRVRTPHTHAHTHTRTHAHTHTHKPHLDGCIETSTCMCARSQHSHEAPPWGGASCAASASCTRTHTCTNAHTLARTHTRTRGQLVRSRWCMHALARAHVCVRASAGVVGGGSQTIIIIAAAGGGISLVFLVLVVVVVLVVRSRRNANAVPAPSLSSLTTDTAPTGVHQSPHFGPPAAAAASHRPRCENDGRCYRQNPAHWADFYHANQHAPMAKPVQGAAK